MGRADAAVDLHGKGCNCAQAVLAVFAPELGLEQREAIRIATAFGGGMGRTDGVCGTVTGACMVLGLRSDMRSPEDRSAKDTAYSRMKEFDRRFRDRHGDTSCTGLIGVNLSTPEGLQAARDRALFTTRCADLIRSAVEILEEMAAG